MRCCVSLFHWIDVPFRGHWFNPHTLPKRWANSAILKSTYGKGRPWQVNPLAERNKSTIVEDVEEVDATVEKQPTRRGRAKRDGAWVGSKNPMEFYAYSAFFDDRTSLMTLPVVRVIVVTEAKEADTLYCLLRYENRNQGHLITAKRLGTHFHIHQFSSFCF